MSQSHSKINQNVITGLGIIVFCIGTGVLYHRLGETNTLIRESISLQEQSNKSQLNIEKSLSDLASLGNEGDINKPIIEREPVPAQNAPSVNIDNVKINLDGLVYGNKEARFSMVTYMDFECPFCQRLSPTPRAMVDSANNGLVNWVWKTSPLAMHEPLASIKSKKFMCAGLQNEDNYWQIAQDWGTNSVEWSDKFFVETYKLNKAKYDECVKDSNGELTRLIEADKAEGKELHIDATPTTVIIDNQTGKRKLVVGAMPMSEFVNSIEEMAR